jgi:hypothetical protein
MKNVDNKKPKRRVNADVFFNASSPNNHFLNGRDREVKHGYFIRKRKKFSALQHLRRLGARRKICTRRVPV